MRRLGLSALIFICVACPSTSHTAPPASSEAGTVVIEQAEARKLALQKYRHLFHNAYRRDPKSGAFGAYPPLEEASFEYVESRGDAWLVRAEPLAGWIVRARVAKNGDWVDLHTVEFANQ